MTAQSPFLNLPPDAWLASNDLAFAVPDGFPVAPGHALVLTKRLVPTWFDATPAEQAAMMALVNEVRDHLLRTLQPVPDGFNVGFNAGPAAGQTVPHVHIHVIPRYTGDCPDPTGGVRHVIPGKGNYLRPTLPSSCPEPPISACQHFSVSAFSRSSSLSLATGHPQTPLWQWLRPRLGGATEIDILASFVQPSGLDLIQRALFAALREGARVRILAGDYLCITSPEALKRLLGWMTMVAGEIPQARFEARLAEIDKLGSVPESFHPKAWRIASRTGGMLAVGSSNLSRAALQTGIEWNLVADMPGDAAILAELSGSFDVLWQASTPLDGPLVAAYALRAAAVRRTFAEPEAIDQKPLVPKSPRTWQIAALRALARIRAQELPRALVSVATGLGKTWLAAFDALAMGDALGKRPRVLLVAHCAEILVQAEATLRAALESVWPGLPVSWYLGNSGDMTGDLVVASVQKLSRPDGLAMLDAEWFDYAVIDEVHHAEAPSYRRVLARLRSRFTLGLTATPERADGVDVATLFDDVLAWHATIGDGIKEDSLVPFHYTGIKDAVDFKQIPWRNGKFDPGVLEEKLENSARMQRLWQEWQAQPAARTLVFCCSRRHALYTRDWLRSMGVRAAAVFSGDGGDPRVQSLADFESGALAALCAVDLFNEGLDIPDIDRVVMLRPTESKVVFLQQLGRGLRASDGKSRLLVLDFVGNHRVFANRLLHLLSLGDGRADWSTVRGFLDGAPPVLPDGCLVALDMEAKDILKTLLPTGGSAAIEAYRALRIDLQRRPSMVELFHRGYLPSTIRARAGSWFDFVAGEGDLTAAESAVSNAHAAWLKMLELTNLNKSYKMVVLRVLLDHGTLWSGMDIAALSLACRAFLLAHENLHQDMPPEIDGKDLHDDKVWTAWWLKWPLGRWLDTQSGRQWFTRTGDTFKLDLACPESARDTFESMTSEIVDYRLAQYTANRLGQAESARDGAWTIKVSHSGGKPILRLPTTDESPGRPMGPTEVTLPDGSVWLFRFVKVACNFAAPPGYAENQLPELLRGWFGADAGLPGTGFHVTLTHADGIWSLRPAGAAAAHARQQLAIAPPPDAAPGLELITDPAEQDKFTRLVPVYSLEAAAGLWGPEMSPEEIGWTPVDGTKLQPGMFVARVRGHSMEPKIPDGSWCLFSKRPEGSREGRIVLVQFNSIGDPETGGKFTIKKYHSEKTVTEDGFRHDSIQLLPTNQDYHPIEVDPEDAGEMLVVGEFVRCL